MRLQVVPHSSWICPATIQTLPDGRVSVYIVNPRNMHSLYLRAQRRHSHRQREKRIIGHLSFDVYHWYFRKVVAAAIVCGPLQLRTASGSAGSFATPLRSETTPLPLTVLRLGAVANDQIENQMMLIWPIIVRHPVVSAAGLIMLSYSTSQHC